MANPRCYIDTKTAIKTRITKRRSEAARIQHSNPKLKPKTKPIATKNETNKTKTNREEMSIETRESSRMKLINKNHMGKISNRQIEHVTSALSAQQNKQHHRHYRA